MYTFVTQSFLLLVLVITSTLVFARQNYSVFNRETDFLESVELQYYLNKHFSTRFVVYKSSSVYFKKDIKLDERYFSERRAGLFLFDWHPFAGHFRSTMGVNISSHKIEFNVVPQTVNVLGGLDVSRASYDAGAAIKSRLVHSVNTLDVQDGFQSAQVAVRAIEARVRDSSLDKRVNQFLTENPNGIDIPLGADVLTSSGEVKLAKYAPYLGVGWGTPVWSTSYWRYSVDIGAIYQKGETVDFAVSGSLAEVYRQNNQHSYAAMLQEERLLAMERISQRIIIPYVSVSLAARF